MRISPLRHPVAVLRTTIGLTQKEMGALVNRAARTIQAVELGHLPLSEGLAVRFTEATGIGIGWLLEGDASKPPWKTGGGIYTRDDFEQHRARLEATATASPTQAADDRFLIDAIQRLLDGTAGKKSGELVRWKLSRMLVKLFLENGGKLITPDLLYYDGAN
jgi:hypothetical protein